MKNLRDIYAKKALNQIPRLLGNLDRNPFSPSYGCFHRDYWLDKTSDFPDAVRQFGAQALALVYKYDMPGSIYKGNQKIRDWAIAALAFWAKIQHNDGSFDEFYPNERGWVGPTAFTTFTSIEAYNLLKDDIEPDVANEICCAIRKAAYFIIKGESEEDHLANHHAMACLAVWKSFELLKEPEIKDGYSRLWQGFLTYHNDNEGWSREYDGIDPGYLSATVSFLGKIYQTNPDPEILQVVSKSIEMCSYFVYPNGFYGGSIGSRNTLHFYSHGFEVFAKEIPMAQAVAEKMLKGLAENKLVPPEIISDRYVFYRVPEYLQSYIDYSPRSQPLPLVPYEQNNMRFYFPDAGVWGRANAKTYIICNLAKGGVIKIFDKDDGALVYNDCGLLGVVKKGNKLLTVTTQWIDPDFKVVVNEDCWEVVGNMNVVPGHKYFTVFKNIIFRSVLLLMGWNSRFAHFFKGWIRKVLILGRRPIDIKFNRSFKIKNDEILIRDSFELGESIELKKLLVGDEFFVRYVPQSHYFQAQELNVSGEFIVQDEIKKANETKSWERIKKIKR